MHRGRLWYQYSESTHKIKIRKKDHAEVKQVMNFELSKSTLEASIKLLKAVIVKS